MPFSMNVLLNTFNIYFNSPACKKRTEQTPSIIMQKIHTGTLHFYLTNAGFTCLCETHAVYTFYSRTWCSSALKGPVSIRTLQEAASSITVSVNIVSPHLPIGSLCFGLQHLCFQTCVLTGPHLALLSGTPLPKRIKLISTLHAASILKSLCSKTSFSLSLSLFLTRSLIATLRILHIIVCVLYSVSILVSRLLWKSALVKLPRLDAVGRWQPLCCNRLDFSKFEKALHC